jgi:hypothetical protein
MFLEHRTTPLVRTRLQKFKAGSTPASVRNLTQKGRSPEGTQGAGSMRTLIRERATSLQVIITYGSVGDVDCSQFFHFGCPDGRVEPSERAERAYRLLGRSKRKTQNKNRGFL